jgi:hypothetical protein
LVLASATTFFFGVVATAFLGAVFFLAAAVTAGFVFFAGTGFTFLAAVFLAATLGLAAAFLGADFLEDDFVAIIFYYFRLEIILQCRIIF